jgi:hypothetical protein
MKRLVAIALVVASVVVTAAGSSEARANGGGRPASPGHVAAPPAANHGFAGRPAFNGHQGFVNHRGFVGHRGFHRGGHGTVFLGVAPFVVGPAFAYSYDPGYVEAPSVYTPPTVYYYCPSAGGYYPDVPVCSEQWVPVPAQ